MCACCKNKNPNTREIVIIIISNTTYIHPSILSRSLFVCLCATTILRRRLCIDRCDERNNRMRTHTLFSISLALSLAAPWWWLWREVVATLFSVVVVANVRTRWCFSLFSRGRWRASFVALMCRPPSRFVLLPNVKMNVGSFSHLTFIIITLTDYLGLFQFGSYFIRVSGGHNNGKTNGPTDTNEWNGRGDRANQPHPLPPFANKTERDESESITKETNNKCMYVQYASTHRSRINSIQVFESFHGTTKNETKSQAGIWMGLFVRLCS